MQVNNIPTNPNTLRVFISDADSWIGEKIINKLPSIILFLQKSNATFSPSSSSLPNLIITGSSRKITSINTNSSSSYVPLGSIEATRLAAECNIVIVSFLSALREALNICELLRVRVGGGDTIDRTIIGISTILTWDRTNSYAPPGSPSTTLRSTLTSNDGNSAKLDTTVNNTPSRPATTTTNVTNNEPSIILHEYQYSQRKPNPSVLHIFNAENTLLSLSRNGCRVHIIASGLPFGISGGNNNTNNTNSLSPSNNYNSTSNPFAGLCRLAWENLSLPSSSSSSSTYHGLPIPTTRSFEGLNSIPTIHIDDLTEYICKVAVTSATGILTKYQQSIPNKNNITSSTSPLYQQPLRYSLACTLNTKDTAKQIIGSIATALGNGKTVFVPPGTDITRILPNANVASFSLPLGEDSTLSNWIPHYFAGHMRLDAQESQTLGSSLNGVSIYTHPVVSLTSNEWIAKEGFVSSVRNTLAPEFIRKFNLQPVKIIISGLPSTGKSYIANLLGQKYSVPVITVKIAINMIMNSDLTPLADSPQRLNSLAALQRAVEAYLASAAASNTSAPAIDAAAAKGGKGAPPAKDAKKDAKGAPPTADPFAALVAASAANALTRDPRLPTILLTRIFRAVLQSPLCRNRGYILDGYPRTWKEAEGLFSVPPAGEDGITPLPSEGILGDRIPALGDEKDDDEDTAYAASTANNNTPLPGWMIPEGRVAGVVDTSAPLRTNTSLVPNAVLMLEGSDTVLTNRHNSTVSIEENPTALDRFNRRLRRAKLHQTTTFTRTIPSFFTNQVPTSIVTINIDNIDSPIETNIYSNSIKEFPIINRAIVAEAMVKDILKLDSTSPEGMDIVVADDFVTLPTTLPTPPPANFLSLVFMNVNILSQISNAVEKNLSPQGPPGRFSNDISIRESSIATRLATRKAVQVVQIDETKETKKESISEEKKDEESKVMEEGSTITYDEHSKLDGEGSYLSIDSTLQRDNEGIIDGESKATEVNVPKLTPEEEELRLLQLQEIIIRETRILERRTAPTRQYLAKTIIQPLTTSLVNTIRLSGEDHLRGNHIPPLDRLADILRTSAISNNTSSNNNNTKGGK